MIYSAVENVLGAWLLVAMNAGVVLVSAAVWRHFAPLPEARATVLTVTLPPVEREHRTLREAFDAYTKRA